MAVILAQIRRLERCQPVYSGFAALKQTKNQLFEWAASCFAENKKLTLPY